jgi:hypothetical protein
VGWGVYAGREETLTLLEGGVVDHLVEMNGVLPSDDISESRTGLGGLFQQRDRDDAGG